MPITAADIRREVKEKNVTFIRLMFSDILGTMKNVEIPATDEQLEIVALTPNDRTQALTIKSEAALVDEYGELGLYLVSAVNFSPGPSP